MIQQFGVLAQTGDNYLPFIVGGVIVALVVLIVALVLMRRK